MSEDLKENIDKNDVMDSIKAREIVREIMDFGVNDLQIKKIIKFLSLELTDRDVMLNICSALEEEADQKPKIEL